MSGIRPTIFLVLLLNHVHYVNAHENLPDKPTCKIIHRLVDSIVAVRNNSENTPFNYPVVDSHIMMFRAFLICTRHLSYDEAVKLLTFLFPQSHETSEWIELGNAYLHSMHMNSGKKPKEVTVTSQQGMSSSSLRMYLLAGRQALDKQLGNAIQSYGNAKETKRYLSNISDYYPYYLFLLKSGYFELNLKPPEFVIAELSIASKQENVISTLLVTLNKFEKFLALSGMSSAHFRQGNIAIAQQQLRYAVNCLSEFSTEAKWFPFSKYDKRVTLEGLFWLASLQAYDRNHQGLSLIANEIEKISNQLDMHHQMLHLAKLSTIYASCEKRKLAISIADNVSRQLMESNNWNSQLKVPAFVSLVKTYAKLSMPEKSTSMMTEVANNGGYQRGSLVTTNDMWEHMGRFWVDSGLNWSQFETKLLTKSNIIRIRMIMGYLAGIEAVRSKNSAGTIVP